MAEVTLRPAVDVRIVAIDAQTREPIPRFRSQIGTHDARTKASSGALKWEGLPRGDLRSCWQPRKAHINLKSPPTVTFQRGSSCRKSERSCGRPSCLKRHRNKLLRPADHLDVSGFVVLKSWPIPADLTQAFRGPGSATNDASPHHRRPETRSARSRRRSYSRRILAPGRPCPGCPGRTSTGRSPHPEAVDDGLPGGSVGREPADRSLGPDLVLLTADLVLNLDLRLKRRPLFRLRDIASVNNNHARACCEPSVEHHARVRQISVVRPPVEQQRSAHAPRNPQPARNTGEELENLARKSRGPTSNPCLEFVPVPPASRPTREPVPRGGRRPAIERASRGSQNSLHP